MCQSLTCALALGFQEPATDIWKKTVKVQDWNSYLDDLQNLMWIQKDSQIQSYRVLVDLNQVWMINRRGINDPNR